LSVCRDKTFNLGVPGVDEGFVWVFWSFFERVYSPTLDAVVGKGETAFVLMPVFGCVNVGDFLKGVLAHFGRSCREG